MYGGEPIALYYQYFQTNLNLYKNTAFKTTSDGKDHETQPNGDVHNYFKHVAKRKTQMQFCFHVRLCDIQAPVLFVELKRSLQESDHECQ